MLPIRIEGQQLKEIHTEGTEVEGWGFDANNNVSYTQRLGAVQADLLCHRFGIYTGAYFPSIVRCYQEEGGISYILDDCTRIRDEDNAVYEIQGIENPGIYPNPADDFVMIRNGGNQAITSVEIYDLLGRKVKTLAFENTDPEQILSIADLLPGNYILKIRSKVQFVNRKLSVR